MDSLAQNLISGAPLSAAKGIGPRLPGLISVICSLFVVLPVLQTPIHYYVGPTIDGIVVKPPETKSFTPTLTLPPPPPPVLPTPITALPGPPSPSRLETTGCVFLVFAGVAAGAGIVLAAKGGGPGKPPNRPGASSSRRKKTKRPHEAPRGPAGDDDGGPPDEDPPPPPPPPGNGEGEKTPRLPKTIDICFMALLLALYIAIATALWYIFPRQFAQLTRRAKRLMEKARFDLNDQEFRQKLRQTLRKWLRQTRAAPMAPPVQDVVVVRTIEMERPPAPREWFILAAVLGLASTGIWQATRTLERPPIPLNTVRPIVNTPNADNEGVTAIEQPVVEDDIQPLLVDDMELPMADAEVLASTLDDRKLEVLQEQEVAFGGQEGSEVEMVEADENREPSKVGETFLGLPDSVPVAVKAEIEWRDGGKGEIEVENEAKEWPEVQPEPVDYVDRASDENIGLEESDITSEAADTDEENGGTIFEAPDSVPVDVEAANEEDARSGGDGVFEESQIEATSEEGEEEKGEETLELLDPRPDVEAVKEDICIFRDGAGEVASITTCDAGEDAILVGSPPAMAIDDGDDDEIETPDEVCRRKLNAEGKRKSAAWIVFSASTDSCVLASSESQTFGASHDIEFRQAANEADEAFARDVERRDKLDSNFDLSYAQPLHTDGPVASSSKLSLPPPKTETMKLDHSWLSESKVHDEVVQEMERQGALGDGWTLEPHTEPQETAKRQEEGDKMATGEEENVDTVVDKETSLVQDKDTTLADPFMAKDSEDSFLPSTPAPRCRFNPSAPAFVPSTTKKLMADLRSLPFWAPNTTPAAVIKPPPTAAEKRAAKLARRAARRAASLIVDDISGNGSSSEMSLFTVDDSFVGAPVHVGSLFRREVAQAGTGVRMGIENLGTGFKEKGINGVLTTPLSTSSPLNPSAIPFVPPTRPSRVEHDSLAFWNPVSKNPVPIVAPLKKKERRRLRVLALQGSISLDA